MERTECASVITLHTSPILYYTCTISLKGRDNVRCTTLILYWCDWWRLLIQAYK